MLKINDGQCGMCEHFGESHAENEKLVQIRIQGVAPEGYTDECGHPTNAAMRLRVAANSGCDGFTPAKVA